MYIFRILVEDLLCYKDYLNVIKLFLYSQTTNDE